MEFKIKDKARPLCVKCLKHSEKLAALLLLLIPSHQSQNTNPLYLPGEKIGQDSEYRCRLLQRGLEISTMSPGILYTWGYLIA